MKYVFIVIGALLVLWLAFYLLSWIFIAIVSITVPMKKVYDNALFVADYLKWIRIKCDDGNKMKSISDIHEDIYNNVKEGL